MLWLTCSQVTRNRLQLNRAAARVETEGRVSASGRSQYALARPRLGGPETPLQHRARLNATLPSPPGADPSGRPTAGEHPEPLLSVEHLSIAFGPLRAAIEPVSDVTFALQPGERVGIVGESGCGKTVTALSLLRLLPPRATRVRGRVVFRGRDLLALSEAEMRRVRGRQVGMISRNQ